MSDDLVKRLRKTAVHYAGYAIGHDTTEAADRIEALEKDRLAWRIAMQRLTPGGSEFMTPQACEDYAAMLKRETVEAKLAKVCAEQALASALERLGRVAEIVRGYGTPGEKIGKIALVTGQATIATTHPDVKP